MSEITRLKQRFESMRSRAAAAPAVIAPPSALARVRRNGLAIKDLTAEERTPEVVLAAVQQNGWSVEFLADEQRTPEVVLAAVRQDGLAVYHLTAEERTPEVVLAAVQENGHAVRHLTDAQRTPAVVLAAVRRHGHAVYHLTDAQRTPEVVLAAVRQNGEAVQFLTDGQRTPQVVLAAVQQNGLAVRILTDGQTPEVIMAAVQQDGHAVCYLTDAQRTPAVVLAAVQQKGLAVKHLTAEQIARAPELLDLLADRWEELEDFIPRDRREAVLAAVVARAEAKAAQRPAAERGRSVFAHEGARMPDAAIPRERRLALAALDFKTKAIEISQGLSYLEEQECLLQMTNWILQGQRHDGHSQAMDLSRPIRQIYHASHGRLARMQRSVTQMHEAFVSACRDNAIVPTHAEALQIPVQQMLVLAKHESANEHDDAEGAAESEPAPLAGDIRPRQR